MDHDWDELTSWCKGCGQSMEHLVDHRLPAQCQGGGNVVAISHLVRGLRLKALTADVEAHYGV